VLTLPTCNAQHLLTFYYPVAFRDILSVCDDDDDGVAHSVTLYSFADALSARNRAFAREQNLPRFQTRSNSLVLSPAEDRLFARARARTEFLTLFQKSAAWSSISATDFTFQREGRMHASMMTWEKSRKRKGRARNRARGLGCNSQSS